MLFYKGKQLPDYKIQLLVSYMHEQVNIYPSSWIATRSSLKKLEP